MSAKTRATHLTPADLDAVRVAALGLEIAVRRDRLLRHVGVVGGLGDASRAGGGREASNVKAAEFNRILVVYGLGVDGRFDMVTGAVTRIHGVEVNGSHFGEREIPPDAPERGAPVVNIGGTDAPQTMD